MFYSNNQQVDNKSLKGISIEKYISNLTEKSPIASVIHGTCVP